MLSLQSAFEREKKCGLKRGTKAVEKSQKIALKKRSLGL